MNHRSILFALVSLSCLSAPAADVKLAPNVTLRFEFPELPDTLLSVSTGDRQPALLTATLPANYTKEGRFPLFLYLNGSEGGRGDTPERGRSVIGDRDFICMSLPLFKRRVDPSEMARGLMISMDDFAILGSSYRAMLQKLLDTVPNIAPERSAIGGFSNGGHATGVLLAGQDDFILEHFRQFFFMEGGIGPLMANVLQKKSLTRCRILVLYGDSHGDPSGQARPTFQGVSQFLTSSAQRHKLDFTFISMRGYGHAQAKPYLDVIGQWARGEKLSSVPPKAVEPAKP